MRKDNRRLFLRYTHRGHQKMATTLSDQFVSAFTWEVKTSLSALSASLFSKPPNFGIPTEGSLKLLPGPDTVRIQGLIRIQVLIVSQAGYRRRHHWKLLLLLIWFLTHLFSSGTVSDDWETVNVIPVFIKGTSSTRSDYRPISLAVSDLIQST